MQARMHEAQQKLRAASTELQQLQAQTNAITHQEKQALGVKSRAAHKVAQLQVRVGLKRRGHNRSALLSVAQSNTLGGWPHPRTRLRGHTAAHTVVASTHGYRQ